MRYIAGILFAAVTTLSGCAQQQPVQQDMPLSQVRPAPVCKSEQQCSAMWARAMDSVQKVTRMRIMSASDTFIQTYPARKVGFLNGQVYKQSLGDGRYQINGQFDCQGRAWCQTLLNQALNLFNTDVQGFDAP